MNRRRFLSLLGLGAAGLALDPERLLWVPGQKTIFLPSAPQVTASFDPNLGWKIAAMWEQVVWQQRMDANFTDDWLFDQLSKPTGISGGKLTLAYD